MVEVATDSGATASDNIPVDGSTGAFELALGADFEGPARVTLHAVAAGRETFAGGLLLTAPTVLNGALPSGEPEGTAEPGTGLDGSRPHVLVYLVDTLRADHLGVYGYGRPTSPRIDEFAGDALVFDSMVASSGWTRTAVASLMTGLSPPSHQVYGRLDSLPAGTTTLASLMGDAGYESLAVITNGIVSPAFGFDQGFDTFRYLGEERTQRIHQYSDRVNETFFDWLDGRRSDAPFFAYLHTMDVHAPYTPPEPYAARFAAANSTELVNPREAKILAAETPGLSDEDVRDDLVSKYDAEIAYNDHSFGELIRGLRRRRLYDRTLLILLSDHGEEFLDHGGYEHLRTLYSEILDVPLILKPPGRARPRGRTEALAEHVDLLPTLLAVAGHPVPEWAAGRSLLPVLEEPDRSPWPDREVLSYMQVDNASISSLRSSRWHVVRTPLLPAELAMARVELYDPRSDPRDNADLARSRPVMAGFLLTAWFRKELGTRPLLTPATGEPDDELRERLRALGYLQ